MVMNGCNGVKTMTMNRSNGVMTMKMHRCNGVRIMALVTTSREQQVPNSLDIFSGSMRST